MNKSPEFDMLKELEEPGKERVRHLNHRKEKDPPHDSQPRGRNNMQSNHKNKTHSQVSSMKNRASKKKKRDALLRLFKATCCYSSMPRTFFNSSSAGGRILHALDRDKQNPAWRTQTALSLHFRASKSFRQLCKSRFFGGVYPADCTGEQNHPKKPRCRKQKPFQQG